MVHPGEGTQRSGPAVKDDRLYLIHAREFIARIEEYTGEGREAFYADIRTQDAVLRMEAQYVLPLAYRVRVLFTWNLRELFHFIQLRSAKQGHFSYRRIAQQVYAEIERVHPALARYIRVDHADYQLGRL